MQKEVKSPNLEGAKPQSQYSHSSNATTVMVPQGKLCSSSGSSASGTGHPTFSINSNGSQSCSLGTMPDSPNDSPMISEARKSSSDSSSGLPQLQAGQKKQKISPIIIYKTSAQKIDQQSTIFEPKQKQYRIEQNKSVGSPLKKSSELKPPTSNSYLPANQPLQTSEYQQMKKQIQTLSKKLEESQNKNQQKLQKIQQLLLNLMSSDKSSSGSRSSKKSKTSGSSKRSSRQQQSNDESQSVEGSFVEEPQRDSLSRQTSSLVVSKKQNPQINMKKKQKYYDYSNQQQQESELKKSKFTQSVLLKNEQTEIKKPNLQKAQKEPTAKKEQEPPKKNQKKLKKDPEEYLGSSVKNKLPEGKEQPILDSFHTHLTYSDKDQIQESDIRSDQTIHIPKRKLLDKAQKQIMTETVIEGRKGNNKKREKGSSDQNAKLKGCCGI